MATIFLTPDPVDGRIYPKRGRVTSISKGFVTLHEGPHTLSIPIHRVLRVEWEPDEEVQA